jgi:hypothetical protein
VTLRSAKIPYADGYGLRNVPGFNEEKVTVRDFLEHMGVLSAHGTEQPQRRIELGSHVPKILFDDQIAVKAPRFLEDYETPSWFRISDQFVSPQISLSPAGGGAPFHSQFECEFAFYVRECIFFFYVTN